VADHGSWPAGQAAAEWRAGWRLVVASTLGYMIIGMSLYSLSAFIMPLQQEFGWSRTLITSGPSIYAATSLFGQPVIGWLVDRVGPRPIGLAGIVATAITFALFSAATKSPYSWIALWLLYSLSAQLVLTPVWTAAVASEFEAGRGLALAITLAGSAISGIAAPLAATVLIAHYDWHVAFIAIGLVNGLIILIPCLFLFHSRADKPRGDREARAEASPADGMTLAESLRSPVFWKLMFSIFIGYITPLAMLVSLLPLLVSAGASKDQAAVIAASFGIAGIVGKLICGVLVNRIAGHVITAVAIALPIISYLILLSPGQPVALLALAIFLVGCSTGSQLKMSVYLTTRYFGMRAFASIFGVLGLSLTFAGGGGPPIGGILYDAYGDYRVLLMLGIPAAVIGALVMLWVGDYPEVRQARLARAAASMT